MKTIIGNFSSERLEQEIANIYFAAHQEAPGVRLQEKGNLALLWAEFEERLAEGTLPNDTDWTPKEYREGYYE